MIDKIQSKQNEIIISLLARNTDIFGEERIKKIVTRKKINPNNYVKGYNACNGQNNVTQLANIIGVKQGTLTPILKDWERESIIYNIGDRNRPLYVKILNLKEEKDAKPESGNTERVEETQLESSETDFPK